jgi:hypothetical protein
MTSNPKYPYHTGDLVAVVWLTTSAARVRAGTMTWKEAAQEAWAIEAAKADRVTVLAAVDDNNDVVGAWHVGDVHNQSSVPPGKTRKINRAWFELEDDAALDYLAGPSPWERRRNPQTTFELRDLPGADALVSGEQLPTHGVVTLGEYSLLVHREGSAELRVPAGRSVTIYTAG